MIIIPYADLTPELAAAGCAVIGMPNEDYHRHPAVSNSALTLLDRSPAHFRYAPPREATRAMVIGTAIHTALLEPERFRAEYLLLKEVNDRRASEYKQAIKTHNEEKVLASHEAASVEGMQEMVYAQRSAREALELPGYREISFFATCPRTGLLLKCRFDILTETGIAADIKKTRDARPDSFAKSVFNYRYHVQDAFYSYVYSLVAGRELQAFKFIAIEDQPPHALAVYQLDDDAKAEGHRTFGRNLDTYLQCSQSGEWPAYQIETEYLSLPSWVMARIESELDDEFTTEDDL